MGGSAVSLHRLLTPEVGPSAIVKSWILLSVQVSQEVFETQSDSPSIPQRARVGSQDSNLGLVLTSYTVTGRPTGAHCWLQKPRS